MADEIQADFKIDLKGLKCPLPVVKVGKKVKEMSVGQILAAETTDPGAHADFPAWARSTGNEILKIDKGETSTFYFKKLK